jgi:hypothetical protein
MTCQARLSDLLGTNNMVGVGHEQPQQFELLEREVVALLPSMRTA